MTLALFTALQRGCFLIPWECLTLISKALFVMYSRKLTLGFSFLLEVGSYCTKPPENVSKCIYNFEKRGYHKTK